MRSGVSVRSGAARPPLLLLLALGLVGTLPAMPAARAQIGVNECRYVSSSPIFAEGFDGPDTFGYRLTIRKDGWGFGPAHGGAIAACPLCDAGALAKGVLRIGLAPFYPPSDDYVLRRETSQQEASPVQFALHPRVVGVGLWSMTNFTPRGVMAESDITPVKVFDTAGLARVVRINSSGNDIYGVALAMQDRCFLFFGIFFREDNGPVTIAHLQQVDEAIRLEKYAPRFSLDQLTPRTPTPSIPFPLGDARKQMLEEQKRAGEGK